MMPPALLRLPALAALLGGCGGASLQGAIVIEPGRELEGESGTWLSPADCRDARGATAPAPAVRVARVALSDGREALLEQRAGYDTVLITNSHDETSGRVFEYVSDDGHQGKVLHVLRMTPTLPGARLELASDFRTENLAQGFRGVPRGITLSCALVPAPSGASPPTTAGPPAG